MPAAASTWARLSITRLAFSWMPPVTIARGGVDGNLARGEQGVAGQHSLLWADGMPGFVGRDDVVHAERTSFSELGFCRRVDALLGRRRVRTQDGDGLPR